MGEDLLMLSDLNLHIGVNSCKKDPDAEGVERMMSSCRHKTHEDYRGVETGRGYNRVSVGEQKKAAKSEQAK